MYAFPFYTFSSLHQYLLTDYFFLKEPTSQFKAYFNTFNLVCILWGLDLKMTE